MDEIIIIIDIREICRVYDRAFITPAAVMELQQIAANCSNRITLDELIDEEDDNDE